MVSISLRIRLAAFVWTGTFRDTFEH